MDRFDDLLIKARAEMLGKSQPRQVITKDTAFSMAWDLTKGFEDQMRAMQARQQRPGFMQRMKDSFNANRNQPRQSVSNTLQGMGGQGLGQRPMNNIPLPTNNTPSNSDDGFVDPFGQALGDVTGSTRTTRASGQPTTMAELGPSGFGQGGGADRPLEAEEVPMREDINTEQPPAPAPASSAPVETKRTRSLPPTMRGDMSASQRAKNFGGPSDDRFVSAVQTLVPDSDYRSLLSEVNERRRGKEPREEGVTPLSSADVKQGSPMPKLDRRTTGDLGDRQDTAANEKYQQVSDKRKEYAEAMERFVERGDMTEDEAFSLWEEMQQSGNIPQFPKMKEQTQPSLDEANQMLGGETLNPNQKREAQETPIPKREMAEQPQGGVPTALEAREVQERFMLPESTGAKPPRGGSRKGMRSPITMREDRRDPQVHELPSPKRRAERDKRNKAADKVEAERTPAPQTDLPEAGETRGALDENETAMGRAMLEAIRDSGFGQPQENTESVKKPEPQVEEQTTKTPPTAKQTTLFNGEEQTESVKPKDDTATIEAAQERKANRNKNKVEAKTEALKPIRSMSSEEVGELILDAQEGKAEAISHLKNYGDEVERVHPQFMDEMNDLFGDTFNNSNDDLSLLPSGMRQQLLKENDANVNYSLLPNGWV